MTVTVSAKGQMVIPSSLRERYGIKAQSKVELLDLGREIVIVPTFSQPIRKSKGILKGLSSADLIKYRRQERKQEHLN